ncbi:MAG: hypothetical protein FWD62_16020 [Betaproteobacteria bacterium]|nr:hypothetical protein [Betaproteobacteria bacterium]
MKANAKLRQQQRDTLREVKAAKGKELNPRLLPLIDDYYVRAETLRVRGWESAFMWQQFDESFSENTEELLELRKCTVELIKERMPWVTYRSAFLDDLRLHFPEWQARNPGLESLWDDVLCRAGQHKCVFYTTKRPEWHARMAATHEAFRKLREAEIQAHATEISLDPKLSFASYADRLKVWTSTLEATRAEHGLSKDRAFSTSAKPVFTRRFSERWKFALWADPISLRNIGGPTFGQMEVIMRFVPADTKKFAEFAENPIFSLAWFLPTNYHFLKFFSLTELESNVRAWLAGLCILLPDIERAFALPAPSESE